MKEGQRLVLYPIQQEGTHVGVDSVAGVVAGCQE